MVNSKMNGFDLGLSISNTKWPNLILIFSSGGLLEGSGVPDGLDIIGAFICFLYYAREDGLKVLCF